MDIQEGQVWRRDRFLRSPEYRRVFWLGQSTVRYQDDPACGYAVKIVWIDHFREWARKARLIDEQQVKVEEPGNG